MPQEINRNNRVVAITSINCVPNPVVPKGTLGTVKELSTIGAFGSQTFEVEFDEFSSRKVSDIEVVLEAEFNAHLEWY